MNSNNVETGVARPLRTGCFPCSHLTFQRIFLFSLARLCIYLNKIYQDFNALDTYYTKQAIGYVVVSILSLVLPSLIYAIYLSYQRILKVGLPAPSGTPEGEGSDSVVNQFFQGLLLIPWQIKRHLDGLYFTSQRLCPLKEVKPAEQETLSILQRNAEVLEFFENFYAGFLQILLQLYILSLSISAIEGKNEDLFLLGEVIGSAFSIFSMLVAVRRRDDGIFTGFLSFIGWIAMFVSRSVVFALAVASFGWWFVLFGSLHVLAFTIWVYRIALESYQDLSEVAASQLTEEEEMAATNSNSNRKKPSVLLTFFFFGLPSLLLWPFMFQLKEKRRPLIFLLTVTIENAFLLLSWYGLMRWNNRPLDLNSLLIVVIATITAIVFLSLYFLCKPSLTDEIVLHDMLCTDTDSFGIYYEFCNIVFKLKVSKRFAEELKQVRSDIRVNN